MLLAPVPRERCYRDIFTLTLPMSPELKGSDFQPNFPCNYSVVIPRPLPEVFVVLGTSTGHDHLCHLSK